MLNLALAAAFFLGTHAGIAGTRLRFVIIERIGNRSYVVLYSVLSTVGTVWLFTAYLTAPYVELWGQVAGSGFVVLFTMFFSFLFLVLGLTARPATLFGEQALDYTLKDVTGVVRITRHPILVGLLIWSITHMIVNGDVAALILFGGLTFLTALGIGSMEAKHRDRLGDEWVDVARHTSIVPFAAIARGRNRLVMREIGWRRLLGAILIFVVMLDLHVRIIGVSPLPAALIR